MTCIYSDCHHGGEQAESPDAATCFECRMRWKYASPRSRPKFADWTPFVEAHLPDNPLSDLIRSEPGYVGTFRNSRYQVQVREYDSPMGMLTWLSIVNVDRSARHDWRDFQRIKNELIGPEREAFELYPAESRLVDTNNQYHLFVLAEGVVMPIGYADRQVADDVSGTAHKQRPFKVKPTDLNAHTREVKTRIFVSYKEESHGDAKAGGTG